ncbi:hypothetical protein QQF64_002649 [Cirrhinus molitorella]|uniref:Up-regulator of cell proliferation-like domain-containing protein n=1 Tax=Cirrhinus molitorella TaxID=172907 RepID=A0ABR3MQS8_9TELE
MMEEGKESLQSPLQSKTWKQTSLTITTALTVAVVAVVVYRAGTVEVVDTVAGVIAAAVAGSAAGKGVAILQSLWKAEERVVTAVAGAIAAAVGAVAGSAAGTAAAALLGSLVGAQSQTGSAVAGAIAGAATVALARTQLQWATNKIQWAINKLQWVIDILKQVQKFTQKAKKALPIIIGVSGLAAVGAAVAGAAAAGIAGAAVIAGAIAAVVTGTAISGLFRGFFQGLQRRLRSIFGSQLGKKTQTAVKTYKPPHIDGSSQSSNFSKMDRSPQEESHRIDEAPQTEEQSTKETNKSPLMTENIMKKLLENLGLVKYFDEKLTLHTVLQINKNSVTDVPLQSPSDLPWLFLKRLMMLQRTARSVKCSSSDGTKDSEWDDDQDSAKADCPQSVNPLDILTAVFLCSDSFLQQEMIMKMSMCQFAVPLLLPNSGKNQITLMLWAMRDIVKKYRPHSLSDPSRFVEKRIALSDLPLMSFVRLGRCKISKSEILNKLLSNPQQYTDVFVHFNMDCGNINKKISNGLVEISWYLPCGNKNIDVFPEPVAIANLRGDIQDFETQYAFLCEASTAVFVFFESQHLDSQLISVPICKSTPQLFFVGDSNNGNIKATVNKLKLMKNNFIFKANQNDADFIEKFHSKLQEAIKNNNHKMSVVGLAEIARKLNILVDEDAEECQHAKKSANEITSKLNDIVQFKEKELALQGEILIKLAKKLDAAVSRRNGIIKVEVITKTYMETMEKKVLDLLKHCREKKSDMSDSLLDEAFEKMWQETVSTLSYTGLQKQDIITRVLLHLRKNLESRGSSMAQRLDKVKHLHNQGHGNFVVKGNIISKKIFAHWIKTVQEMSDNLIRDCSEFVKAKRESKDDYDETYIREILNMIDGKLKAHENMKLKEDFELSLKLHICGFASREFQNIHNQFIQDNNPCTTLENFKQSYHSDFIDLYRERDQCQKKADEFVSNCLKPALEKYISENLGMEMADKMVTGENSEVFGTRTTFQISVLKNLLDESQFETYLRFIMSYETFVKMFIFSKVREHFTAENRMFKLEEKLLNELISNITEAIEKAEQDLKKNDIKGFIENICKKLEKKLVFPKEAVDKISTLNNANQKKFTECLQCSVKDMENSVKDSFQARVFKKKINGLQTKPQDVLFKRVWGCGKQCPFCKAPCEAGGEAHTKHFVSIHRPEGLGRFSDVYSNTLVTDICTSSVHSNTRFKNHDTNDKWHPYKEYSKIYPDWRIDPDSSIEASVYWKYVMANFNEQFADTYDVEPADIPSSWVKITVAQVKESLEKTSNTNSLASV